MCCKMDIAEGNEYLANKYMGDCEWVFLTFEAVSRKSVIMRYEWVS